MSFCIIGISHKTASATERSQFAFTPSQVQTALLSLSALGIGGVLILSTCNRTEIYAVGTNCEFLINWLASERLSSPDKIQQSFYQLQDHAAVKHAIAVACGLKSMVMGEPQILGQLKTAIATSCQQQTFNEKINFIFQFVVNTAKKVRHQTALGHCPVSVAFSAVKLAQQNLDLTKLNTIIIGAGSTATLVLKHLLNQHPQQQITIVNRSLEKAEQLASQFGIKSAQLELLRELIPAADLIISATASENYLIDKQALIGAKDGLYLIDLSLPANIDPAVAQLENIKLHSIDDIEQVINDNTLQRTRAALDAEKIIAQQLEQYLVKKRSLDANNTVSALREQTTKMTQQELAKALEQLQQGKNPELIIEQFAHRLTNKWLHLPTVNLKQLAVDQEHQMLELTQLLFELEEQRVRH